MSQRTRSIKDPDLVNYSDRDLENALNDFLNEQQTPEKVNLVNFTTMSGFAILSLTSLYIIQLIFPGLGASIDAFDPNWKTVTFLGGTLVALAALGVFSREKKKRKRTPISSRYESSGSDSDLQVDSVNDGRDAYALKKKHKLFRSRSDKKIFGVCAGIASYLGINPFAVRLIWAIATLSSAGVTIPLYILAALIIPKEPKSNKLTHRKESYE